SSLSHRRIPDGRPCASLRLPACAAGARASSAPWRGCGRSAPADSSAVLRPWGTPLISSGATLARRSHVVGMRRQEGRKAGRGAGRAPDAAYIGLARRNANRAVRRATGSGGIVAEIALVDRFQRAAFLDAQKLGGDGAAERAVARQG